MSQPDAPSPHAAIRALVDRLKKRLPKAQGSHWDRELLAECKGHLTRLLEENDRLDAQIHGQGGWKEQVQKLSAVIDEMRDAPFRRTVHDVLILVAQVFDGWHQDGTHWTEHDESVRQGVSTLLRQTERP